MSNGEASFCWAILGNLNKNKRNAQYDKFPKALLTTFIKVTPLTSQNWHKFSFLTAASLYIARRRKYCICAPAIVHSGEEVKTACFHHNREGMESSIHRKVCFGIWPSRMKREILFKNFDSSIAGPPSNEKQNSILYGCITFISPDLICESVS